MLDLYTETKQWKKAIEIIMQLAELEKGRSQGPLPVAAGNIATTSSSRPTRRSSSSTRALDEDPDYLKAFEAIDKIMTAKKDWKKQERNYRKMIKRLRQEAPDKNRR